MSRVCSVQALLLAISLTSALNTANPLSQTLGLETGTTTTITSGGSINAGSGTLDGSGNRVFTVTSISFPNGTFTVNGTAADFVVLNIADGVGNNGLNGSVVLSGGIVSDRGLDFAPAGFDEHIREEHVEHSNALHARIRERGTYLCGPLARDPTGIPFR